MFLHSFAVRLKYIVYRIFAHNCWLFSLTHGRKLSLVCKFTLPFYHTPLYQAPTGVMQRTCFPLLIGGHFSLDFYQNSKLQRSTKERTWIASLTFVNSGIYVILAPMKTFASQNEMAIVKQRQVCMMAAWSEIFHSRTSRGKEKCYAKERETEIFYGKNHTLRSALVECWS